MRSSEDRFWNKVDRSGECWEWIAATAGGGYGVFRLDGRNVPAHRLSYAMANNTPIPPRDMDVCHTCDNRSCVNPAHLFLGSRQDNVDDMVAKRRHFRHSQTHCKRGHEFTPDNTYAVGDRHRGCVTCKKAYDRAYKQRRKSA